MYNYNLITINRTQKCTILKDFERKLETHIYCEANENYLYFLHTDSQIKEALEQCTPHPQKNTLPSKTAMSSKRILHS